MHNLIVELTEERIDFLEGQLARIDAEGVKLEAVSQMMTLGMMHAALSVEIEQLKERVVTLCQLHAKAKQAAPKKCCGKCSANAKKPTMTEAQPDPEQDFSAEAATQDFEEKRSATDEALAQMPDEIRDMLVSLAGETGADEIIVLKVPKK